MFPAYSDLRVGIARDPENDYARLYIWAKDADGRRVQVIIRGQDAMQEVRADEGKPAKEPSLTLPWDLLQALRAAVVPDVNAGEAVSAHLRDAIAVRDRLLTLVERKG